ncbi:hypothetical protein, partial [Acinetobacter baumannii]|uniref:hypothetical protein n=1 Tax=Acinetobacter baumannii TaxID=470 RepID=UPI003AF524CD
MESTAFNHASLQPLHSIGNHWAMLHGIHCIQTRCMESTAINPVANTQLRAHDTEAKNSYAGIGV